MYDQGHDTEAKALKIHQPCQHCGSSDAAAVYDDGHWWCFSCQTYTPPEGLDRGVVYLNTSADAALAEDTSNDNWQDRRISKAVTEYYDVLLSDTAVCFQYYDKDSNAVARKVRRSGKKFYAEGHFSDAEMFGYQTLSKGVASHNNDTIIVTEGESDALAAFQMANRISPEASAVTGVAGKALVPVLSVRSGASGAERDFKNNLQLFESFRRVFICFDNDEPGRKAAEQCAKLLHPGRAYVVSLTLKDACEYNKQGRAAEFVSRLKDASCYTPSGIRNGSDNFDALWSEQNLKSIAFPWKSLENKTLGIRPREIITWAAGTGVGKSSVLRELQHHYLKNTDMNIGIIALEESVDRTRRGIMAVEANDKLHLNEVFSRYSRDDIRKFFDATLGSGRVYLYDHFGSMQIEDLLSRVRYMVVGLDCKVIFIDHLSILVSGLDMVDERKAIDRVMTLLRQLTEETGCAIHLVTHLRRLNGDKSHEEGIEVNLGHLRGSHGIAQISDTVVAMERDTQSDDEIVANTTTLRVLKCRYTGDVGLAGELYYDKHTGRMKPLQEKF